MRPQQAGNILCHSWIAERRKRFGDGRSAVHRVQILQIRDEQPTQFDLLRGSLQNTMDQGESHCLNKIEQGTLFRLDVLTMRQEFVNQFSPDRWRNSNRPGVIAHKCQEHFGYLPAEVQEVISNELVVPVAKIYGVVTFYSFFTMTPKGKHPVSICMGTACYVRGAEKVLDEFKKELHLQVGQTTKDGKFSLSSLRCVGACGLAPVVLVGDKTYGRVAPDDVKNIIKEYD